MAGMLKPDKPRHYLSDSLPVGSYWRGCARERIHASPPPSRWFGFSPPFAVQREARGSHESVGVSLKSLLTPTEPWNQGNVKRGGRAFCRPMALVCHFSRLGWLLSRFTDSYSLAKSKTKISLFTEEVLRLWVNTKILRHFKAMRCARSCCHLRSRRRSFWPEPGATAHPPPIPISLLDCHHPSLLEGFI